MEITWNSQSDDAVEVRPARPRKGMYHMTNIAPIKVDEVVHHVYHRGELIGSPAYVPAKQTPFYFQPILTQGMRGRVECVERSPHYAYAYTCEEG